MIVIFAKPPVPGQVKTRLAAAVGEAHAAALARAFLQDTARAVAGVRAVVATTDPSADHGVDLPTWDQGCGDLGARIERMLARALEEDGDALAIGADSPGMPPTHLRALVGELTVRPTPSAQVALGPAEDGGFWGIRASRVVPGMLSGIRWSAPTTLAETRAALEVRGLAVATGPSWWDIDTVEDLDRFRREIPRERAPATHAVLDG